MSNNRNQRGGRGGASGRGGKGPSSNLSAEDKARLDAKRAQSELRLPGYVYAVPSGDSVVLLNLSNQTHHGPPEEIQLTFNGLRAPALGRKQVALGEGKKEMKVERDEPFAWQSREYLRNLLIGKSVVYRIEHTFNSRSYGEVWLNEENVRFSVVENGWADVNVKTRTDRDGKVMENRKDDQLLLDLQQKAQNAKLGKWNPNTAKAVRDVTYRENTRESSPAELHKFFEQQKGKNLKGVVEQVRNGSTFRVYVPSIQTDFTVNLSGIHCPLYKFNVTVGSEPFANEAKFFSEYRLLNREVSIKLECMDKFDNFFATVLDSQGRNIVGPLLGMGLGKFVSWNAPSQQAAAWEEAEKKAKEGNLKVWKKQQAAPASGGKANSEADFVGTVVEISSAGSVLVRITNKDGSYKGEQTVTFASLRAPRQSSIRELEAATKREEKAAADALNAPKDLSEKQISAQKKENQRQEQARIQHTYSLIAQEFLRKELLGKKVKCVYDYTSSPYTPPGSDKVLPGRVQHTVYTGNNLNVNIALKLVSQGLAEVIHHSPSDNNRASDYADLIAAEKAATTALLGLHAPRSRVPTQRNNDLSNKSGPECKKFLPNLKRKGNIAGVVDYVFGAPRLKITIPSEGVTIGFSLQGCMSQKPQKNANATPEQGVRALYPMTKEGDPVPANAALHFARDTVLQRDVILSVDDADSYGTFFGSLKVNGKDYLLTLLEAGYAQLHFRSAESLPLFEQYKSAQQSAQNAKKGIWWNYDAEEEARKKALAEQDRLEEGGEAAGEEGDKRGPRQILEVLVTEITSGSHFFFQIANEEATTLMEDLMTDFASRDWDDFAPYSPKSRGEKVAGKFSVDGNWYRAEVIRAIAPAGQVAPCDVRPPRAKPATDGAATPAPAPVSTAVVAAPQDCTYEVRFIDYGNSEVISYTSIRELLPEFSTDHFVPQAKKAKLAYIKTPALDEEFGQDAGAFFKEVVWGKTMKANIQFKEGDSRRANRQSNKEDADGKGKENGKSQEDDSGTIYHVMLGDLKSEQIVNHMLLANGLARLEKRKRANKALALLADEEQIAKNKRLGIWQYGELPDSDEDEQWARMLK